MGRSRRRRSRRWRSIRSSSRAPTHRASSSTICSRRCRRWDRCSSRNGPISRSTSSRTSTFPTSRSPCTRARWRFARATSRVRRARLWNLRSGWSRSWSRWPPLSWRWCGICAVGRKGRIDRFYSEALAIRAKLSQEPSAQQRSVVRRPSCEPCETDAFSLLINEKLSADESFRILQTLIDDVIHEFDAAARTQPRAIAQPARDAHALSMTRMTSAIVVFASSGCRNGRSSDRL